MMMASKKIKVTRLNHESKVLLLTILKQGYITAEQKQAFSSLLEVKTYEMIYVSKQEDLEELEKMYQEIESLKMLKNEAFAERGYIEKNGMSHEEIKRVLS